jgi:membrane fusion protein (multidrug efflux system)
MPVQDRSGNGHSPSDPVPAAAVTVPGRANVPAPPESFGRGEDPDQRDGNANDKKEKGKKNDGKDEEKPPLYKRPLFWAILAIVVVGGAIGIVMWYLSTRGKVSTDDAFVQAHVTNVSPRVAGHVIAVLVNDNQEVKRDDILVKLDPTDFQQALDSAIAQREVAAGQIKQANAQVAVAEAQVAQAKADITAAQANATQAQEDLKRYQQADRRAVSQQQVDAAQAAARSTEAALESSQQKLTAAQAQVTFAHSQVQTAKDQLSRAQVAVEQAQTQLSYAVIRSPIDGQVTNRNVSVGDWVQTSQGLMGLVPKDVYVIANFKETELKGMKPGQKVIVSVDAYDGIKLKGHVQSIQAGSGAAFSLLPPENATGNYVKIVQRVPVKITLDEQPKQRLGPGMSVVPTVYTRGGDNNE